jgi:hypothetical protein
MTWQRAQVPEPRKVPTAELWGGPLDGTRLPVFQPDEPLVFTGWDGAKTAEIVGRKAPVGANPYPIRYQARPSDLALVADLGGIDGAVRFDYTPLAGGLAAA